jgi:hypothetical protein
MEIGIYHQSFYSADYPEVHERAQARALNLGVDLQSKLF